MSSEIGNCGVAGDPQARGNLLRLKPPLTRVMLGLGSEKAMAPHSSSLAWRIPGTGEPGKLQSMGSHRVGHD